jgi:hypothetical protein
MAASRPRFRWAAKTRAAAAFCLAGFLVGTGLYFSNLSYVTVGDEAARAAVRAAAAAAVRAAAAARQARIVTLSGAAAASLKAPQVLSLIHKYFDAINTRNYAEFSSTLDSASKNQSEASFDAGYATTTDSNEVIRTITTSSGRALTATVSFTSHQDPAESVDGSTCNNWILTFYLAPQGSGYVITPAPPSYQPTYTDC